MRALLVTLAWSAAALAAVVEHHWDTTWVWAAPDGFARPVIGINGQWPCPTITANKGDQIVVHLTNKLGNQTTGLHWHGINQVSTNDMDGAVMATQCPLAPGRNLTYSFMVSTKQSCMVEADRLQADEAGTFWCKSHVLSMNQSDG